MKLSTVLFSTACNVVLASDDRDLRGDVWAKLANTPTIDKRQSTWNPPAALLKPLQEVWDHQVATYNTNGGGALAFKNYGYDIINAGKGYVSISSRSRINAWRDAAISSSVFVGTLVQTLQPLNVLPLKLPFKRMSRSGRTSSRGLKGGHLTLSPLKTQLEGTVSGDFYTTRDGEGIPECDPRCGRFFQ